MTNQSKVATVEAQAVPDQPVATLIRGAGGSFKVSSNGDALKTIYALPPGPHPLFTRPTPAAADLHQQIMNLPINWTPGTSIPTSYLDGHRDARRAAAQLVAASPAAAADWQISAIADKHASTLDGHRVLDEVSFGRELLQTFASPVAPVGAPTEPEWRDRAHKMIYDLFMHDEQVIRSVIAQDLKRLLGIVGPVPAHLLRPGCELATDATKQLGEHSVHPAMSTSSVPTAAPLLSSRETDRSELPREPL